MINESKVTTRSRYKAKCNVSSNQKRQSEIWNKFKKRRENIFETWKLNETYESNKDLDVKHM